VNEKLNFDNILEAMVSLYVIASTEGWIDMMWIGVDSRGIGQQPSKDYQLFWSLFYIGFIVVGSFFIMNLFAGVVVDSFNSEREKIGGVSLMTPQQKNWIDLQKRILAVHCIKKYHIPKSGFRGWLHKATSHWTFEVFILFCIAVNTIAFLIQWERAPKVLSDIIS
jgi:hypothetical protein